MSEALDCYKQIAKQFPGNEKADAALFRAGLIAYGYFTDLDLAKNLFFQLSQNYPDSYYRVKSKRMVEHIDKKIAAKERIKLPRPIEQKKVLPKRTENKEILGNMGFIAGGER